MTMRLIVPGASGFIGRNLILAIPADWEVVALYNTSLEFPGWITEKKRGGVAAFGCDLTNEAAVRDLADRVGFRFDACVFLAANGDPAFSVEHPFLDLQATVVTLIRFLSHFQIDRFIYFSSGAVYDGLSGPVSPAATLSPRLPYAITNWACERYIVGFERRERVGQYVNLRFFGAYGPYEPPRKIYTRLIRRFAFERVPQFTIRGDGRNYIDAMHVEDAIRGIMAVLESDRGNVTVDFCSGSPLTINGLVEAAARTFGLSEPVIEHVGQVPEYNRFSASNEAMAQLFNFRPKISIEEGLTQYKAFLSPRTNIIHG